MRERREVTSHRFPPMLSQQHFLDTATPRRVHPTMDTAASFEANVPVFASDVYAHSRPLFPPHPLKPLDAISGNLLSYNESAVLEWMVTGESAPAHTEFSLWPFIDTETAQALQTVFDTRNIQPRNRYAAARHEIPNCIVSPNQGFIFLYDSHLKFSLSPDGDEYIDPEFLEDDGQLTENLIRMKLNGQPPYYFEFDMIYLHSEGSHIYHQATLTLGMEFNTRKPADVFTSLQPHIESGSLQFGDITKHIRPYIHTKSTSQGDDLLW
jgi:hypothetical protein